MDITITNDASYRTIRFVAHADAVEIHRAVLRDLDNLFDRAVLECCGADEATERGPEEPCVVQFAILEAAYPEWKRRMTEAGIKMSAGSGASVEPDFREAEENLRARCAEILEWKRTGILRGTALREYAAELGARFNNAFDTGDALALAERETARELMEAVVGSTPSGTDAHIAAPREALSPDLIERVFEIGFRWRGQLIEQTLEDSRAVGRTLFSYLFDGMTIETNGFDSFASSDAGIVEAKKRIITALRALAADTPPASGDVGLLTADERHIGVIRSSIDNGANGTPDSRISVKQWDGIGGDITFGMFLGNGNWIEGDFTPKDAAKVASLIAGKPAVVALGANAS